MVKQRSFILIGRAVKFWGGALDFLENLGLPNDKEDQATHLRNA